MNTFYKKNQTKKNSQSFSLGSSSVKCGKCDSDKKTSLGKELVGEAKNNN